MDKIFLAMNKDGEMIAAFRSWYGAAECVKEDAIDICNQSGFTREETEEVLADIADGNTGDGFGWIQSLDFYDE